MFVYRLVPGPGMVKNRENVDSDPWIFMNIEGIATYFFYRGGVREGLIFTPSGKNLKFTSVFK